MSSSHNFEKNFRLIITTLKLTRTHPNITRNKFWMCQIALIITMYITVAWLLTNSIFNHDIKSGDFSEVCKNVSMLVICNIVSMKFYIFITERKFLIEVMNTINQDYQGASGADRDIVVSYINRGVSITKFWMVAATSTSFIYPIKAALAMLRGYLDGQFQLVPMFDLFYPQPINENKLNIEIYIPLFLLCLCFASYSNSMFLAFDPFVPILMLHVCGQIDILNLKISNVFSTSHDVTRQNLKMIVVRLQELYKFIADIKKKFTIVYEMVLKTSTAGLPLSAFQIVQSMKHGELNVEFICYFCASILHFWVPCYYSNQLMDKGEELQRTIYCCKWEYSGDLAARKTVLLMLLKATKPLAINSIFYTIVLETFTQMCRDAYAIFNIMNAAWS
nr:odorant receptor 39 [Achelura yunnanensis]